ncbi:MAG: type II toxin-antitoxin system VapC family toxin [Cyanobium sp.]
MAIESDRFLVDTHLLIWWASMPEQLPEPARRRLASRERPLFFSLVSLWEVAIKASLGREDFQVDPGALRRGLLREGFQELPIEVEHVLAVQQLPWIHRDPFDRLLVAQALREGLRLLSTDRTLLGYGDGVMWAG